MEFIGNFIQIAANLDHYLNLLIENYGWLTYLILFLVIVLETGLVVTPCLPGDSLLFTGGVLAAASSLSPVILLPLFAAAAIIGDSVNYEIGRYLGPRVFERDHRFIKQRHLALTQEYYQRYGNETIVIARFIPIIRTFAPFVAGIGSMPYRRFLGYNALGSCLWVTLFVLGGYFFGNLPVVQNNFSLILVLIVFVSILPGLAVYLVQYRKKADELNHYRNLPGI